MTEEAACRGGEMASSHGSVADGILLSAESSAVARGRVTPAGAS